MISTLLFCMVLGTLVVWFLKNITKRGHRNEEPPVYSDSLPLIGLLHKTFIKSSLRWDLIQTIGKNTAKEGGIVTACYGPQKLYFVTDVEIAATVANQCLDKMYFYKYLECWLGQGIFIASVPIWKPTRKLINPMFGLSAISKFLHVFNDQAKKLVEDIECKSGMESFEASGYIRHNVLKTICSIVFGNNDLHDDETFKKYLEATHNMWMLAAGRFLKIWQHSDLIYKLSGNKRKQDELARFINEICDQYIQKWLAQSQTTSTSHSDDNNYESGVKTFLDMYLEFMKTHNWTLQDVRDTVNTTIGGAFDTVSNEFEIILIYIGSHPEIQELLYQEIIREVGLEGNIEKEGLQKLVYTEAIIKEVLRLLPVTPIVARVIESDLQISSGIGLMLYNMNRDPCWGPDADQFRPERWLKPGGVPSNSNYFASFSIGRRNCIGKTYALISLKMYLAHFVRKFKIEADYKKLEFIMDGLLRPDKGNDIKIERRI